MPVTNDIMKRWGITLGTLYQTAKKNTPKLMPLRIQSLFQQVSDYKELLPMRNLLLKII